MHQTFCFGLVILLKFKALMQTTSFSKSYCLPKDQDLKPVLLNCYSSTYVPWNVFENVVIDSDILCF